MSDKKKGGSYRSGDFYGAPNQPAGNYRRNNIGNVQPGRPQSIEDTQPYNIGSQQQYRPQQDNRQFQRPAGQPQQPYPGQQPYQGQPYQQYPNQQYPGQQPPPPNNYYGGQPPYGQQPYPPYGNQYYPQSSEPEEESGGKGTMILIIITLLIILAIAGTGIYILLKKNDENKGSNSSENIPAAVTSETLTERDTEPETEETSEEETTEEKPDFAEVPKAVGSEIAVVRIKFEKADIAIVEEYEFSDDVKKDYVISQSVPEGTQVKPGSEVKLVISKGSEKGDLIEVPDVTGTNYKDAAARLESAGLNVIVDEKKDGTSFKKDTVIMQKTAPKSKVAKGTAIHLVIAYGEDSSDKKTGKVVTEETALNIRKSPSFEGDIIGTLERGATIEITGESGNWYIIDFNGGKGYVSKDYIQVD